MPSKISDLEKICHTKGLKMTGQRRVIAKVMTSSDDHPDVEEIHRRANKQDSRISLATVYRTVRLLEETGIIKRLDFGDGRARYESEDGEHHDHLIDIKTGKIIEFVNDEMESLKESIAAKLGYELKGHRLELYGVPIKKK